MSRAGRGRRPRGGAGPRPRPRGAWLLLLALVALTAAPAGALFPGAGDEDDGRPEGYAPLPEFRPYPERDRLALAGVTLIRVARSDRTQALVAREASGWEHVVLEGHRLAFYSLGRQALRRVPGRHVLVQEWSGGAHCCFDFHVLWVDGVRVYREGTIRAGDCELQVADLNRDGDLALISCDARFAYAFGLAFAESPLVPLVYSFRDTGYVADNRRFSELFRVRIREEQRRLAEAERQGDAGVARGAVLSLLLHRLYAGWVTEGWCEFEKAYRWADGIAVRQEVLARLRRRPDPDDVRLPFADVSYALEKAARCP